MDFERPAKLIFISRLGPDVVASVLLTLLLFMATSCGGRDEPVFTLGSEGVTLAGQARLVCSDQCRGSSQCGTIGNNWVILASSSGPATEFHDLYFPADAQVDIVGSQMEIVQSVTDPGLDQRMAFYAVNAADQSSGWVAGWCIGQEIVP